MAVVASWVHAKQNATLLKTAKQNAIKKRSKRWNDCKKEKLQLMSGRGFIRWCHQGHAGIFRNNAQPFAPRMFHPGTGMQECVKVYLKN